MKNNLTYKIALTSIFTALVFLATIIAVPMGLGYINLGDTIIFVASLFLGFYAVPAAIIGSCLADLIVYPLYIPATALIKGTMALVCSLLVRTIVLKGRQFLRVANIEQNEQALHEQASNIDIDSKKNSGLNGLTFFLKLLLIFFVGSVIMQIGYITYELLLFGLGNEDIESIAAIFAVSKLLVSSLQTFVCVPLAALLGVVLVKYFDKYFTKLSKRA